MMVHGYNSYQTQYKISLEGNDKFSFSVDGENSVNNVINKVISGGEKIDDNFNIEFFADINDIEPKETATLKISSKNPYSKEISLPINLNLHEVTVNLNANGGSVDESAITVYKGKTYASLPTPTWAGHVFNGWYSAKTGGTKFETTSEVTTSNSSQTLYAQWTSLLLADKVSVGDYVNYPVSYTNVATTSSGTHIANDSYKGWRVLSIEGSGNDKYVRLVSAGIPMTYVHSTSDTNAGSKSVTNLTTNFFSTAISSTSTNYKYRLCGFKDSDGGSITTITQLKNLFTNEYTQLSSGVPNVQAMTKDDVDNLWGDTTSNGEYLTSNDLIAIPAKDQTSAYATYHLATAKDNYLWDIYWEGAIVYTSYEHGIRPVITLKTSVETTGQIDGTWQLK